LDVFLVTGRDTKLIHKQNVKSVKQDLSHPPHCWHMVGTYQKPIEMNPSLGKETWQENVNNCMQPLKGKK
jgi:hypothetical protein